MVCNGHGMWLPCIAVLNIQEVVWIYYPGHVRVCINERGDSLASRGPITGILIMDRAEKL